MAAAIACSSACSGAARPGFHFVDLTDPAALEAAIKRTPAGVGGTPTNPLLKTSISGDLRDRAQARLAGWRSPTPRLTDPHRPSNMARYRHAFATKFLNGHSTWSADLVVGAMPSCRTTRVPAEPIGAVQGPFDSFLALRGLKTLHLRMRAHCENAAALADFLVAHPAIEDVIYPGLAKHPQHALAKRQMDGHGGIVSIRVKGGYDGARRFCETHRCFTLAESLGGVESLVNHPAVMTHASVPQQRRAELGIGDDLVRLSVGVEDVADLRADLEEALR